MAINFAGVLMTMQSTLREMAVFRDLGEEVLGALASGARVAGFEGGEPVFCQDDAASQLYVVLSGQVKITRSTATGREQTLYIVEPGEPFCFCTLFGQLRQPVNATALKKAEIVIVEGGVVERTAYNNPTFLLNILEVLNNRLMNSMRMIEDLALRGIPQRLASFLLHSARLGGDPGGAVRLSVPKHEVAKILGTTPETLSRVFARMSEDGLIEVRKRTVRIIDADGLALMADS